MKNIVKVICALWILIFIFAYLCGCSRGGRDLVNNTETRATDWPQIMRDSSRTSFAPHGPKLPLESVWEKEGKVGATDKNMVSGSGYLVTRSLHLTANRLECLDATNGKVIWTKSFKKCVPNFPQISGEALVFEQHWFDNSKKPVEIQKYVVCLRLETGAELWKYRIPEVTSLDGSYTGEIDYCIYDGRVFLVTERGRVFVIDIKTGKVRKDITPVKGSHFIGMPIIGSGKMIVAHGETPENTQNVFAIDLDKWRVAWSKKFDDSVIPTCIYDSSVVVEPSPFYSHEPEAEYGAVVTPQPGYENEESPRQEFEMKQRNSAISCLDVRTGTTKWSFGVKPENIHFLCHAVSLKEPYLLFAGPEFDLRCLNTDTGKVIWRADSGESKESESEEVLRDLILTGENVVVVEGGGDDGKLVIRNITDGINVDEIPVNGVPIQVICANNSIYALSASRRGENDYWRTITCFR